MGDQSTILVGGGVGAAFSIATYVFIKFIIPAFNAANHKRIRSVCCGRVCVSSFDVEETTPVGTAGVSAPPAVAPIRANLPPV